MGAPRPLELRRGNAVAVRAQNAVGDSGDRFSSWRRGRASGERLRQGATELPLPGQEQWWFDARPRIGQESWVPLMPCATSANSLVEVTSPCRSAPSTDAKDPA
jgi:hypothetical protein